MQSMKTQQKQLTQEKNMMTHQQDPDNLHAGSTAPEDHTVHRNHRTGHLYQQHLGKSTADIKNKSLLWIASAQLVYIMYHFILDWFVHIRNPNQVFI